MTHLPDCEMASTICAGNGERGHRGFMFCLHCHRRCICPALRACEQRVRDELPPNGPDATWYLLGQRKGRSAALDAARDAVEKVGQQHPKWDLISTHYEGCWKSHPECALTLALAAIDALREGQK